MLQSILFTGRNIEAAAAEFPAQQLGPSSLEWKDGSNTTGKLLQFYRDIPRTVLDGIREVYELDFELFGYNKYLPFETPG